ncbi:MAG: hypothetical protein HY741_09235 [Chloroflexi bacterium]|nr:hypothetical protein [Chloroflexota bacterium]
MMRKHLTAAAIFVVLTVALTNPLALHVWNAVEDKQDGLLNTWIVAWVGHALTTDPLNLFNTNIFYPYPNTLAFSEILLPPSLFATPITLATNNPVFGYNLALLAMLWLDAFGMYLFVYDVTRRVEAGWVAGVVYAFNLFNLGNLAQMQLLTLGFLPLALLALRKLLLAPRRPQGAILLFSLFFVLQSLSSFYYALLAGFAVALYLLCWLWTRRADIMGALRRVILPLIAAFVIIALVLTPFLLPYFSVQRELGFSRRVEESEPFSASLKQFSEVAPENLVYGKFLAPNPVVKIGGYPLDNLFPGVIAILLAACGLLFYKRARENWFLVLLLVGAFVLALGPRLYVTHTQATDIILPYRWLYDLLPPMRALRAPVRFDALVNFALAGLTGMGAAALMERYANQGKNSRRFAQIRGFLFWFRLVRVRVSLAALLGIALICLISLESLSLPAAHTVTLPVANEIPEVYQWLAQQPPGVVLELPMMGPNENGELDISTQYFSTYHWQKTPDGYSGFVPPRRGEIAYEMEYYPNSRSLALLRELDVRFVLDRTSGSCGTFGKPYDFVKPVGTGRIGQTCVFKILPQTQQLPQLDKRLYVPSTVAAGAPFDAYLILANHAAEPYAVKPTDRVTAEVHWSDNRIEQVSFPLPLVTSSASVVPIRLTAPPRAGDFEVRLQTLDPLIGATEVETAVHVGDARANEVVIPASVRLNAPLPESSERGKSLPVYLTWLPYNKIDAYYSASVRLVKEDGEKVANADRQPIVPTLLWRPDTEINDDFELTVPPDVPPGKYRVEILMYQADTDTDALMLDKEYEPQPTIPLGSIQVK